MPPSKPLVGAAFICERVLREEDNVLSAIRIVDKFTMKRTAEAAQPTAVEGKEGMAVPVSPPASIQIAAFVLVKAGEVTGDHELSIAMRNPAGKVTSIPEAMTVQFNNNDPSEGASLIVRLMIGGDLKGGVYWVDVLWDKEPLTAIPFRIVAESESPEVSTDDARSQ